jgi:hypothetical protein
MYTWIIETPDGIRHTIKADTRWDALVELALQYMEKDIHINETNTKVILKK